MKGKCLLCGVAGKLTRDHVPPQGVVVPGPIEVRRMTEVFTSELPQDPPRRQYNAPDFATICGECNVTRLGKAYDPALIKFANGMAHWVRGAVDYGLRFQSHAKVDVQPNRVARAIVGHTLAADELRKRSDPLSDWPLDREMREFFLDETIHDPSFHIYVWPYPSSDIVIMRGFGASKLGVAGPVVGNLLKFFPLAFWAASHEDSVVVPGTKLPLTASIDDTITLHVPLSDIPRIDWPENPGDMEILLLNRERTHHARRETKKRK